MVEFVPPNNAGNFGSAEILVPNDCPEPSPHVCVLANALIEKHALSLNDLNKWVVPAMTGFFITYDGDAYGSFEDSPYQTIQDVVDKAFQCVGAAADGSFSLAKEGVIFTASVGSQWCEVQTLLELWASVQ